MIIIIISYLNNIYFDNGIRILYYLYLWKLYIYIDFIFCDIFLILNFSLKDLDINLFSIKYFFKFSFNYFQELNGFD